MSIKSVVLSNHLIFCCPLLLLPSIFLSMCLFQQVSVFSNKSVLCIRWPKYWSLNFSINPSNEYSGLISFRIDLFDLLAIQGLSRVSSNTTVEKHQFFSTQPSLWFYEDIQDLLELTPKKDVLFIIGNWNAKVRSQEIPGVTGKFGLEYKMNQDKG